MDRYHDILTSYVDRGGEDHLALLDRMVKRGAVFGGRPICTLLRPDFLLRSQHTLIAHALRHFRNAVRKAKDVIQGNPELLDAMGLTDGERRLLDLCPETRSLGVSTRLDMVLCGADLQLMELNAEGAFGVGYADGLTDLFEAFQPMREFSAERQVTPVYSEGALVGAILDAWHDFGGTRLPRVALVDWREVATRTEFDLICERFQRQGVPARFVDPRELEYRDGELLANGEVIDVVYRRVLTSELLSREDEVKPLLEACRARVACVVNSFRAKLLDKKMLFALLHDPRVDVAFSAEEREVIAHHVPWTRKVEHTRTSGPEGAEVDLVPWIAEHRLDLVIKPNDEVGGRGVVIGANVEPGVWERALELALVDPSVVQRRVPLASAMFPEVGAAGEMYFSRRYLEPDAYLFRGEFKGLLTRLSSTTLCNVHAGAGTVPTFIIEDEPR
ncbi:Hypothetical protein CAP_0445 [Chondromyces apiculatus DSM 436]|uniref:Circularly permuted type 2 ATP-grasp protein n=1 Tax=Chondromyces apiculatus DSM 436 TaxID=1192034 RepID=A0A017SUF5_9BACT|nr:Hypothetical protein CAP_0445 [Chondromyces apiculatus DSM 436]